MAGDEAAPSLDNTGLAFGLVTAAGLSTALGAAAVFWKKIVDLATTEVLAAGLGFSGGVMLYVSFVEIFVKSQDSFEGHGQEGQDAYFCATLCLFAGMLLMRVISWLVHMLDKNHSCDLDALDEAIRDTEKKEAADALEAAGGAPPQLAEEGNPATQQEAKEKDADDSKKERAERVEKQKQAKLQRMGLNTAAAIAIHNFPEGLATFVATLAEPSVGATLAIAIGIHNIPEGLCVALPIYYATGNRWKGFLWALLSGISEPIGAFIGWCIIKSTGADMSLVVYGVLFGLVAGMMIMIVILELLPTAYRYDPKAKYVTNSIVLGMAVMAASLCLFQA